MAFLRIMWIILLMVAFAAAQEKIDGQGGSPSVLPPATPDLSAVPLPDTSQLEASVKQQLNASQDRLRALIEGGEQDSQKLSEYYGLLGQLYHAYKFAISAEPCYRNAAKLAPRDFKWTYLLGILYDEEGEDEKAHQAYRDALAIDGAYAPLWIRIGQHELRKNNLYDAWSAFDSALGRQPYSPTAYFGMGQIAMLRDEPEEAVKQFEKALHLLPEANRIHYPLGQAYRKLGNLEKAREHLSKAGKVGPKEKDTIVEELEQMVTGERIHIFQGKSAFAARRYKEAAELFRKAVEAAPESTGARVNLGSALALSGDAAGALEQYSKAAELDPENSTAQFNLGHLYTRNGELVKAETHLRKAFELAPTDMGVKYELASLCARIGKIDEAISLFEAILAKEPGHEESQLRYITLLIQKGEYNKAGEKLEAAYQRHPDRGRLLHLYARFLAACPDPNFRNGERAVTMANLVFKASPSLVHGETLCMALAEADLCEEAAKLAETLISEAQKQAQAVHLGNLQKELERYRAGAPCRVAAKK